MPAKNVDYSLYLVTDSTMLPPNTTVVSQVEAALRGGATVVQLREKALDTREFIDRAREIHRLTKEFRVPLIINDRVDVALAVGCEGVHVGQDDMPASVVREMLGPEKIVGVSVRDSNELNEAIEQGVVDYVGIGAVFGTQTKKLDKAPMGIEGVKDMLTILEASNTTIQSVVIGGVNDKNAHEVITGSTTKSGFKTDGVAVVSCIMASTDALKSTRDLSQTLRETYNPHFTAIAQSSPLVHHITNNVVKNFSANVTLAIGASPIMSEATPEFAHLAAIPSSCLVLNTGTLSEEMINTYNVAIDAYKQENKVIVFDPVGCGASDYRLKVNTNLLAKLKGPRVIIKGNAAEIMALAGHKVKQRGVDGVMDSSSSRVDIVEVACGLAKQQSCNVVVTGATDHVCCYSDNNYGISLKGGHPLMGRVTGSGCSLSSVIAAFVQSNMDGEDTNEFEACAAAVDAYKTAGSIAGKQCGGPGTFVPLFLDTLSSLAQGKIMVKANVNKS